jgi:hypothetical protein
VCVETVIAGHNVTVSIECRDHGRPADVVWVEQMKAKHDRLPTNALVLVSRSGFTPEAQAVARRYGIDLLSLTEVTDASVNSMFGNTGSLWAKFFTLWPKKVVIAVAAVAGFPGEQVASLPDNTVFTDDGQEAGSVQALVEYMLRIEHVVQALGRDGSPNHQSFEVSWDKPQRSDGRRLCLQKLDPLLLRPIEAIRVLGSCQFKVSEFRLRRGRLGEVPIVWSTAELGERPAMLVATGGGGLDRQISLHPGELQLEKAAPATKRRQPKKGGRSANKRRALGVRSRPRH